MIYGGRQWRLENRSTGASGAKCAVHVCRYAQRKLNNVLPVQSFNHKPLLIEKNIDSGAGIAQWKSAGLVIERSRVRAPEGAAGEFSSPKTTF